MPRLLLVDDDLFLLHALNKLLTAEGYVCVTAETAEDASDRLKESPFDMLVLDVTLPKQDGFAFCRQLRAQYHMPILFLTAREEVIDTVTGLEVGGDDYLTKPFAPRELIARVRARLRRAGEYDMQERKLDQIVVGELIVDADHRDAIRNGIRLRLTDYEFKVLHLLAQHREKALAGRWIYEHVWGGEVDLDLQMLSVYMRRLRLKIERDPAHPRMLLTLRGFGYKLTSDKTPL